MSDTLAPVAVDGASGYVGNHVVAELRKAGIPVRCIVHPGIRDEDRQYLKSTGAELFETDLNEDSDVLMKALIGSSCIIHLIGSIAPPKGQKLSDLHAGQTAHLIAACRRAQVGKILMVTALGTAADAPSEYHKTKFQSEDLVRKSGLNYVIIRPSLIIGSQVGHRQSKLVARYLKLIDTRPNVPVINGGKNLIQPVFVGDLARAIVKAATEEKYDKQIHEIGGFQTMPMSDFIQGIMKQYAKSKPLKAIPAPLAQIGAFVLEMVSPGVPLLSRDQVTLACNDNICSDNAIKSKFGIDPISVEDALKTYERVEKKTAAHSA